jgi:hypothetical protein
MQGMKDRVWTRRDSSKHITSRSEINYFISGQILQQNAEFNDHMLAHAKFSATDSLNYKTPGECQM